MYLSPDLSEQLLHRLVGGSKRAEHSPVADLSDRELEAFQLLGQGLTTQQIAEKMHVSPKTIETYRVRIKEKLNVENIAELIQKAVQWVMENSQP